MTVTPVTRITDVFLVFVRSEMEREEWTHVIRKHAVNSLIDNGYEIRREDKDSKLGSGSYSTVWKGVDKDTRKVWAVKEMQKAAVKREVRAQTCSFCVSKIEPFAPTRLL